MSDIFNVDYMKFVVSSAYLSKRLQVIGSVIGNNNAMPILENFLFEISENQLVVSATDLITTIRGVVEITSDSRGCIAVPSKLLIGILKDFSDQPLTFEVKENNLIEISSSNGKYSLAYVDGQEFPSVVEVSDAEKTLIPANVLSTAIQKTLFATGDDSSSNPAFSGVLLKFSPSGTTFVATDAHKLVKYERADIKAGQEAQFIMPKKTLNILKNILKGADKEEVAVEYNSTNAKFSFEQMEIICQLISANYPNYESIIPKETPNVLTLDRNLFLGAVIRNSKFASDTTHQIRFKISESLLQVSAEDLDFSKKSEETISCHFQGEPMEIGFNSKYLIEMLGVLNTENVEIRMSLPNRAGILAPSDGTEEGETITMLLMPTVLPKR